MAFSPPPPIGDFLPSEEDFLQHVSSSLEILVSPVLGLCGRGLDLGVGCLDVGSMIRFVVSEIISVVIRDHGNLFLNEMTPKGP